MIGRLFEFEFEFESVARMVKLEDYTAALQIYIDKPQVKLKWKSLHLFYILYKLIYTNASIEKNDSTDPIHMIKLLVEPV